MALVEDILLIHFRGFGSKVFFSIDFIGNFGMGEMLDCLEEVADPFSC